MHLISIELVGFLWRLLRSMCVCVCVKNWIELTLTNKICIEYKIRSHTFQIVNILSIFFFFISISWSVFIFSLRTKVRVWLILWLCASIGLTWKMSLEMKEIYILKKQVSVNLNAYVDQSTEDRISSNRIWLKCIALRTMAWIEF